MSPAGKNCHPRTAALWPHQPPLKGSKFPFSRGEIRSPERSVAVWDTQHWGRTGPCAPGSPPRKTWPTWGGVHSQHPQPCQPGFQELAEWPRAAHSCDIRGRHAGMPGQCHHLSPAGTTRKEKATQNWALGQSLEPCARGWPPEKKGPQWETGLRWVAYQDLAGHSLANERAPASQAAPLGEAHWPHERVGGGPLRSPNPSYWP